jgi:hypothetical protein
MAVNFLAASAVRSLKPPWLKHKGSTIKVPGSFWSSGVAANEQDTLYLVRVIDAKEDYKVHQQAFLSSFQIHNSTALLNRRRLVPKRAPTSRS